MMPQLSFLIVSSASIFVHLTAETLPPQDGIVAATRSDGQPKLVLEATFVLTDSTNASALRETLHEAAFTLLTCLAAAAGIAAMKKRNSRNLSQRSLAEKVKTCTDSIAAPDRLSSAASLPRPTLAPSRAPASSLNTRSPSANSTSYSLQAKARAGRDVSFSPEGDALASAVRHGSARHLPSLLDAAGARATKAGVDKIQLSKLNAQHLLSALRACASRRCFPEALAVYNHMQHKIGDGCGNTWSLLLYSAVEEHDFAQCGKFVKNLMSSVLPSGNDLVNMVRFYANYRDLDGLTQILRELRGKGFLFETVVRNRAISACASSGALELAEVLADEEQCPVLMDTIGYNILMKAYSNTKRIHKCFGVYNKMRQVRYDGSMPSAVTFGILLDACIDAEQFEDAKNIFDDLRGSDIQPNVVHYTALLKGLARAGRLDDATHVLDEMRGSANAQPDLVTYSTLVKAHSDQGRTIDAMRVVERMIDQHIDPDGVVLNIVLASCAVHAMPCEKVSHVFQWLRRHGLHTTTATLSILIKAFARSESWEVALDLLDDAPTLFNFWPQMRLYAQLAQACAKVGDGAMVVRCYVAMVRSAAKQGDGVDEATNSRLHRLCVSCGESAVAAAIYCAVARAGGFPEPETIAEALATE